jgi:hypothetical protein
MPASSAITPINSAFVMLENPPFIKLNVQFYNLLHPAVISSVAA